jgi:hypothetical protein
MKQSDMKTLATTEGTTTVLIGCFTPTKLAIAAAAKRAREGNGGRAGAPLATSVTTITAAGQANVGGHGSNGNWSGSAAEHPLSLCDSPWALRLIMKSIGSLADVVTINCTKLDKSCKHHGE